jgi:hypothetical protein
MATATATHTPTVIPTPEAVVPCGDVSGVYFQDTRWGNGCTYYVKERVEAGPGATLYIDPGVTVVFRGSSELAIRGRLIAEGTPTERIVFRCEGETTICGSVNVHKADDEPHVLSVISYAHIERTSGVQNYLTSLRVTNSTFFGNSTALITSLLYNATSEYTHNLFYQNDTGIQVSWVNDDKVSLNRIEYNTIIKNKHYGVRLMGGSAVALRYNNIYENGLYDVYVWAGSSNTTNLFRNNWWGTTDTALISQHIYDYYDDTDLQKVIYQPFATEPIQGAPVAP